MGSWRRKKETTSDVLHPIPAVTAFAFAVEEAEAAVYPEKGQAHRYDCVGPVAGRRSGAAIKEGQTDVALKKGAAKARVPDYPRIIS